MFYIDLVEFNGLHSPECLDEVDVGQAYIPRDADREHQRNLDPRPVEEGEIRLRGLGIDK